jgi:hypothetical protein
MMKVLLCLLLMMCQSAIAAAPVPVGAADAPFSVGERLQLPNFCWGVYLEGFSGPEYSIPEDCGGGMNHYCLGLLELNRAKRFIGKSKAAERGLLLGRARGDLYYTKQAIEKFPSCSIRSHIEASVADADAMWKAFQHR